MAAGPYRSQASPKAVKAGKGNPPNPVMPQFGRALSPKAPQPGHLGDAVPPKTEALLFPQNVVARWGSSEVEVLAAE